MNIEPMVPRFRVFDQMHCSQGFYSFVQRGSAKKILLNPPKSFHDWKQKFFFIKVGVIPMRMTFRGKEDIPIETIQTPVDENWYQDPKDVPSISLSEKALVGACMSLNWRMDREEKRVYTEDGKVVSLYVVAFEMEGGKMATIAKKPDEELSYHRIVKNFVLPRDAVLSAQPAAGSVIIRRPKPEPKDAADIPPSNPEDPIDLESSPGRLVRNKEGKRKQTHDEAEGQPEKKIQRKKITRRGNLDAFISESVPENPVSTEPSSVANEELPLSPPCASVAA
ncbi:hypothetical protein HanOQP8_Chr02g0051011 [Helianthus annuus]|nr:hypothetical protein HanOQP8_Chr02g0051011 [Helianthus annuus]